MRVISKTPSLVWKIVDTLPERLSNEIYRACEHIADFEENICEIRIRAGRRASLTCQNENISLSVSLSKEEIEGCVKQMCKGSAYAYSDMIKRGYIYIGGGCRVGIVGTAVTEKDNILGVRDISSVNIRIPRNIQGLGIPILNALDERKHACGVLIYSSPGVGKTTLLRSLAGELSKTRRVAIIDSRGELDVSEFGRSCLTDVLFGYPKGAGIEIATRTLSPEYIICDEIGVGEMEDVLSAGACGVPIIASVHAASYEQLLKKDFIKRFFDSSIFGICVGIKRLTGQKDYVYDMHYPLEDV